MLARILRLPRMSRVSRRAAAAGLLVLALAAVASLHARNAHADQPTWSVVEASQDFCVKPEFPCSDFAHLSNLGYEEVAAVNFAGLAHAKPDAVVLVCARVSGRQRAHL